MATQATSAASTSSGYDAAHELFALSDEQILEIEPDTNPAGTDSRVVTGNGSAVSSTASASTHSPRDGSPGARPVTTESSTNHESPVTSHVSPVASHDAPVTSHDLPEPPPWLAAQMKDPWSGEEARELWNGVQQARTEAAAYRAAIASPEDARALKELYPGGISEARAAADRARLLDEVDRAYFGGAGNSPEQTSATRAQLAQQLIREDPTAFREMVETGVRILQEAAGSGNRNGKTIAAALSDATRRVLDAVTPASSVVAQHAVPPPENASTNLANASSVGAQHAAPQLGNTSASEAHVAAYAAFERAANEDLERSVGSIIERTLEQALPSAARHVTSGQAGAQHAAPLQQRLSAAIRQDVEHALQGDRQLGEQVAQILASRRFDNDTRAQVVRLIGERAQQLVPGAAKRVLNEWTQTTLATHRSRAQRSEASASPDAAPINPEPRRASLPERASMTKSDTRRLEASATNSPRRIDYRKLSDEQILDIT